MESQRCCWRSAPFASTWAPLALSGALALFVWPSTAVDLEISSEVIGRSSPPHLLGFGIEDVNHELYGGLYSQMVYGEDFEEPAGLSGVSGDAIGQDFSPTWEPLRAGKSAVGGASFETVSSNVFNGRQAQLLIPNREEEAAIVSRGLFRQGMFFKPEHSYEGYLFARALGGSPGAQVHVRLASSFSDSNGTLSFKYLDAAHLPLAGGNWTRFDFALQAHNGSICRVLAGPVECASRFPGLKVKTPEGECVACSGALVVAASGGPVVVDFVFLQPGDWGRFKGLPVRRDVATALQDVGTGVLRLGGSMSNAQGWRWKNMRGPREHRQPYAGTWHPFASQGWRIFEFLELCEALEVQAVVTLNNNEDPEDLADLIEYAFGGLETTWGRLRAQDGRTAPYAPFVAEIGNEQQLDYAFIRQVADAAEAMRIRAGVVGLEKQALRFAIGHNLDMAVINTAICDAMVNATKFLGDTVMWDLHVDGDKPLEEDHWAATFQMALDMLDRLGSKMKLAVFEENAFHHDLLRGLNRARFANAYARLGRRFAIGTAANGLQVFGMNDNDWDQGAVFMAPDRAWLSPFGQADRLISRASEPLALRTRWSASVSGLDVLASRSENSSALVLRVVNYNSDLAVKIRPVLPVSCAGARVGQLRAPAGANASAVNPPSSPARVSPETWSLPEVRELHVKPMSLVTVRWLGCRPRSVKGNGPSARFV